jgi:hypothetical protein
MTYADYPPKKKQPGDPTEEGYAQPADAAPQQALPVAQGYNGGQGIGATPGDAFPQALTGPAAYNPGAGIGTVGASPVAGPTPTLGPGMPSAPAPGAPPADPLRDRYRQSLLDAMGRGPVTMNDPNIKGQADAFSLAQTRAKDRAREAMAERAARSGLLSDQASSGAFDQGILGLEQQQGEAEAGFNAGLLGSEQDKQRQQLMQAAAMAGQTLDAGEQRQLQERLAAMDEQFRRAQLGQQGSQFDRTFGQQGSQFERQLGEQGRQFDTTSRQREREFNLDAELKRLGLTNQSEQYGKDLDLRRYGIDQQGALGGRELDLRDRLGSGDLNMRLLQTLMQGDQFNKGLGADLGKFNATNNRSWLDSLLAQLG